MLRKKRWITISVLVATLLMLVGTVGGMVYAQTGTTTTDNTTANTPAIDPANTLYAKVATILNIDQQKLEAAFTQARKEMRDEELTSRIKSMVEQGTITQAQADEYLKWWQSRPDIASKLDFRGGPGIPGGPHGMPGPGGNPPPPLPPPPPPTPPTPSRSTDLPLSPSSPPHRRGGWRSPLP